MAISRYNNLKTVVDEKTGKKRMALFPQLSAAELADSADVIVTTQDGESLDFLAHKYLGDGRYWWIIALLNNVSLPLGDFLQAGTSLRIPTNINNITNKIASKRNDK